MEANESVRLRRLAGGWHIEAVGEASLILGGELHNSSSGGKQFLGSALDRAVEAGIDTVLVPVTWEQIEAAPGEFDLSPVDDLITAVEARGLRLVPLWFGAWKNGRSSYAPAWVLSDPESFPHAESRDGHPMPTLSLFASRLLEVEREALRRVVERLASAAAPGTVVALQLNNEVGLLGDSRDRSSGADQAFRGPLPASLADALGCTGSPQGSDWQSMLGVGSSTDEMFMAWHYAHHIEQLALTTQSILEVPLLVNAWLNEEVVLPGAPAGGVEPGDYPSGGPLAHVATAWRLAAPSVKILAPDIYFGNDEAIMQRFSEGNRPLFIPETELGHVGAGRAFLSVGRFGALGISPFGVDQASPEEANILRWAFERLRALTSDILEARACGAVTGFVLDGRVNSPWYHDGIRYEIVSPQHLLESPAPSAYGLLLVLPGGEVLAVGRGFTVRAFDAETGSPCYVRDVYEDELVDGVRRTARRLNGDETGGGDSLNLPAIETPRAASPISVDFRSTGIRRGRFISTSVEISG